MLLLVVVECLCYTLTAHPVSGSAVSVTAVPLALAMRGRCETCWSHPSAGSQRG